MSDYDGDQTIGEMTLDEAAENDREMFNVAIKNAEKYTFINPSDAIKFVGRCIGSTLEYLGIQGAYNINPKMLDRLEKTKQIKVERRDYYKGKDIWRNGFYIYKRDILVSFVSEILSPRKSFYIITSAPDIFFVVTNAKLR